MLIQIKVFGGFMKKIIIGLIVMTLFISGCSNNKIDHVSDILSTNLGIYAAMCCVSPSNITT
jgi:hypothetical protein